MPSAENNPSFIPPYSEESSQEAQEQLREIISSGTRNDILAGSDGPALSGKGSVTELLTENFGYHSISNGNFVRACSWLKQQYFPDLELSDEKTAFDTAILSVQFQENKEAGVVTLEYGSKTFTLQIEGKEDTDGLRSSSVEKIVSDVSSRRSMVSRVNKRVKEAAVTASNDRVPFVAEGRDLWHIFGNYPHVLLVYLTAKIEVLNQRAIRKENKRRMSKSQRVMTSEQEQLLITRTEERNLQDLSQPVGFGRLLPLAEALKLPGYHVIDTSTLKPEETLYYFVWLQLIQLEINRTTIPIKRSSYPVATPLPAAPEPLSAYL